MAIFEDVSAQMKDAMRAGDKPRLQALRNIRAAFIEGMKEDNSTTLGDERCLPLLKKLAKQRRDSIDAYTAAGRMDLADPEAAELLVVESFLPKGPSEDQVRAWVQDAISTTGAAAASDVGRVMGVLMKAHKATLDGAVARKIALELLGG
jgi:uncharacterized protein